MTLPRELADHDLQSNLNQSFIPLLILSGPIMNHASGIYCQLCPPDTVWIPWRRVTQNDNHNLGRFYAAVSTSNLLLSSPILNCLFVV